LARTFWLKFVFVVENQLVTSPESSRKQATLKIRRLKNELSETFFYKAPYKAFSRFLARFAL